MKNILCFGDSHIWGFNPINGEQYPWGIRWTSLLQNLLSKEKVNIVEDGLCGRTTVYEDASRPNRNGSIALKEIMCRDEAIDYVIILLGTNDCKTYYGNSVKEIADGMEVCLDILLERFSPENILLISPIHLGEDVWKENFDPEFNVASVVVSKQLKAAYEELAQNKGIHFMAASDYVLPSAEDQEHMNVENHRKFAKAVLAKLKNIWVLG